MDERPAVLAIKPVPFVALLIAGVVLLVSSPTTRGMFLALGLALLGLAGSGVVLLRRTRTSPELAKFSKWVLAGVTVAFVLLLLLWYYAQIGYGRS